MDDKEILTYISRQMDHWRIPGLALAVFDAEKVHLSQCLGSRILEAHLPVTPRTSFPITSCSKAITAVAMGQLVDEGLITWDQPIRELVPELTLSDPVLTEQLTVRDLLAHQSGLPEHRPFWVHSGLTRAELMSRLVFLKPAAGLRQKYIYSGLMYILAAFVLERVTGRTWEDYIEERILQPLGMISTHASFLKMEADPDHAAPYRIIDEEVVRRPLKNMEASAPTNGVYSNLEDMVKWMQMHLNQGKVGSRQIIAQKTLAETHWPQSVLAQKPRQWKEFSYFNYAMGWLAYTYDDNVVFSHQGGGGYNHVLILLPEEKIGVVVLSNLAQISFGTL